jgi:hypothetical protein
VHGLQGKGVLVRQRRLTASSKSRPGASLISAHLAVQKKAQGTGQTRAREKKVLRFFKRKTHTHLHAKEEAGTFFFQVAQKMEEFARCSTEEEEEEEGHTESRTTTTTGAIPIWSSLTQNELNSITRVFAPKYVMESWKDCLFFDEEAVCEELARRQHKGDKRIGVTVPVSFRNKRYRIAETFLYASVIGTLELPSCIDWRQRQRCTKNEECVNPFHVVVNGVKHSPVFARTEGSFGLFLGPETMQCVEHYSYEGDAEQPAVMEDISILSRTSITKEQRMDAMIYLEAASAAAAATFASNNEEEEEEATLGSRKNKRNPGEEKEKQEDGALSSSPPLKRPRLVPPSFLENSTTTSLQVT